MLEYKIKKLPIVDDNDILKSLICLKDINRLQEYPDINLDKTGRLICGFATGVRDDAIERAKRGVAAGADVVLIDTANGESENCVDMLKTLKSLNLGVDIIAGNIATASGAELLIKAGADGIRCSIGNGSICITRIVAGSGVPQLTALMDAAEVCKKYNVPLISDGGNKNSGNMCKALAAGADVIMLGRMIAGTDEAPGDVLVKDGKRVKIIRGMAGIGANISNATKQGTDKPDLAKFTPEGVEGYTPYTGPVREILEHLCNGIRSGMSYSGARTIQELYKKAKFVRMTNNGFIESGVHDINKL